MKVWLALFCIIYTAAKHARGSPLQTQEDTSRVKRSDDPPPLQAVVNQLTDKVQLLEAQRTADQAQFSAMQAEIMTLKEKRCESGRQGLDPHHGTTQDRQHTVHISFSQEFASKPWVAVSLAELDDGSGGNVRVNSGVSAVSTSGFDVSVNEWADTHLASVGVTWIACSV